MGWQIATLAAAAGYDVALYDALPNAVERALANMREQLPPVLAEGRFPVTEGKPQPNLDDVLARVWKAESLADAIGGADLIVEAVREHLPTKREVHAEISRLAKPDAIISTNSSSIASSRIADDVQDPSRFLNTHFFAPVWVRPMLELMSCGQTRPDVIETVAEWGRSLGLYVAVCRGESMGFIINRVWRAIKRESLRVVDEGHATPEEVDRLFGIFFQTDITPFRMMDTVGLDVVADIESQYIAVSPDPTDRGSRILAEKVAAGELGEKTGKGFYDHTGSER